MLISIRWIFLLALALITVLGLNLWNKQPAIATASQPPYLVAAKLGGKPVSVLYMTRSGDTVLVRCYPGQTPTLTNKDMAGQAGVKEGTLTCK